MAIRQFFNDPANVVDEMLETTASLANVALSEAGSGVRIVAVESLRPGKVAVLSGGGAGHEPAHAGFVGEGMLSAAISGEIFASPSVDAVLAAIRHVSSEAGALLVVKNYTGDRLNFGLARERAIAEGHRVGFVVVADDIALGSTPAARGVAGTLLVHKVAGYWAAQGSPLEEVERRAQRVAESLASLGMALSSSQLPGSTLERRGAELGLGIHNEPGARPVMPKSAREALDFVLEPLLAHIDAKHGKNAPLVVFLNDLGGCSPQEMLVLAHGAMARIGKSRIRLLVKPSAAMTSIDMRGFSVTLLPADDDVVRALEAPTEAPAWPGVVAPREAKRFSVRLESIEPKGGDSKDVRVARLVRAAADALIASELDLDALDAKVGDGDAGKTFANAARQVLAHQASLSTGDPALLFTELGGLFSRSMGGSSGVLASIFFTATGSACRSGSDLVTSLSFGLERIRAYGGANPGDRTLVDALEPALRASMGGKGQTLTISAAAARAGADATKSMRARAGRSAYVPEGLTRGVADPGAEAVARIFEAIAQADH
jgi:ATP-dependent dihydroxyacetone kinase